VGALKKLAGETVIYGMSHILPRILNYVLLTVYLTYRLTDTADFGIYSDLYAYATVILMLMVFRMDTAYFRYASREDDPAKVYFTAMLPLLLVTGAVLGVGLWYAEEIANMLAYPGQAYYVRWFAWILGLDAVTSLIYARFRLASRPLRFMFFRLANVLFTVGFILTFMEILPRFFPITLASLDEWLGIQKPLDYVFFSNLLASALVLVLMLPEIFKISFKFDSDLLVQMLKYSWPLVIVGIAGSINQAVAVPMQKYLLGGTVTENLAQAGIYSAAAKLAILLNLFTTAYNYAAEPFFFNNASKNKDPHVYGRAAWAFTIVCCFVALGTYLYLDIFAYILGKSYRTGLEVVPVLLLSYLFLGLYYNVSIWYKLADKTHIGGIISVLAMLMTLVINYFLLPEIGVMASAVASLVCYAFMAAAGYWTGQHYYPLAYPRKRILGYLGITFLLFGLSTCQRWYWPGDLFTQVLLGSVGLFIYVSAVYFWEKERIVSIFRKP